MLDVVENVTFDGAFAVTLLDGYMPGSGDWFTLIQADGLDGITGLSHGELMAALPALDGSLYWESDFAVGASELTLPVVPEPSTIVLLVIASLAGLLRVRRGKDKE